jgi:tetratricopeptide (TPR) repeat protein
MREVTLSFLLLCAWPAVGAEPPKFPEFTVEGARAYLEEVAREVASPAGDEVTADYLRARLQNQLGSQDQAERLARRALERNPGRADIYSFLGDLFIRQSRLEEASRSLSWAVRLDPNIAGGHRRLGLVLDQLGDREGARKAFEQAVRSAPNDATALLLLGRHLLDAGEAREAVPHLERACQLDPELANGFYALFQAQSRLGDHDAAQKALKTFQRLRSKEKAELDAENAAGGNDMEMRTIAAAFHAEVAAWLLGQQQIEHAEAHLRQALRIAPDEPELHEMLVAFLVQAGRLPAAKAACEELVRMRPDHPDYRVNFGTVLLQLNEHAAAVDELKRALELDPSQVEALHNLTRFYLGTQQELPEALALARRLVAVDPDAKNHDLLAWALFANGHAEEARAASGKAVQLDPGNSVYQQRLKRLEQLP